jgi:nucleotide-binding universal stress UspA family protein
MGLKIVVASDLSDGSARAIRRAFRLAARLDGEIRVVHVVDTALPSRLSTHALEVARETLQAQCGPLEAETGISGSIDVVGGDPRLELVARARAFGAELVVVGVHRRRNFELFNFAGSTPGLLFTALRRPMLLVQNEVETDYARVVVGVDFSIFSRPAIRWARRLAPLGELRLVHGYQIPFRPYLGGEEYAEDYAYAERMELDAFLAEEMRWLEERSRAAGIPVEPAAREVREGAPGEVLRAAVADMGADLLAVGTHGRTGLMKAILGSVAADLVKDPPCDVLMVPARD